MEILWRNENKYQYNYDEFGRLVNETNSLENSQSYFYDDEGNLETKKDFANKTTTYEYDAKKAIVWLMIGHLILPNYLQE